MDRKGEFGLREKIKFHNDLISGRYHNKELVLAARANIAGCFSLAVVIAGVVNGRLDMVALGSTLMIASGAIMLNAVKRS